MIVEEEHDGKLYFYEYTRAYQGQFVQIHLRSEYEIQQCREMFRKKYGSLKKGNSFVQKCAEKGLFNGFMTESEIALAKKKGILPEAYDIHHIVPLSLGGENTPSNLCVIHKDLHTALHKEHLNLIRNAWDNQKYREAYLHVPINCHFLTMSDLELFFEPQECERIRKEARIRAKKAAYHAQRRAEIRMKNSPVHKQNNHPKQRPENWTPEMIRQIDKDYQYQQRKRKKAMEKAQQRNTIQKETTYRDSYKYNQSIIRAIRNRKHSNEL